MTDTEARAEAKRRWGSKGRTAFSDGKYHVGTTNDSEPGAIAVYGSGATWEEAFQMASSSSYSEAAPERREQSDSSVKEMLLIVRDYRKRAERAERLIRDYHARTEKAEERVKYLVASIRCFLAYTREVIPGDHPEACEWKVPQRQIEELAEAIKTSGR